MLAAAKAVAVSQGPRMYGCGTGICLTSKELEKIYIAEGFRAETAGRHMSDWEKIGAVKVYKFPTVTICFFRLDLDGQDHELKSMMEHDNPALRWQEFPGMMA